MKYYLLPATLYFIIIYGCTFNPKENVTKEPRVNNKETEATELSPNNELTNNKCECPGGITPLKILSDKIVICTYDIDSIESQEFVKAIELEVIDCESSKPIIFVYPPVEAKFKYDENAIELIHDIYIPIDTTWKVNALEFYTQNLEIDEKGKVQLKEKLILEVPVLKDETLNEIESEYKEIDKKPSVNIPKFKHFIWKLLLASLNDLKRFEHYFEKIENDSRYPLDGGISEQFSEAKGYLNTYKKLKNK